jgi:hypothetical protein
MDAKKEAADRDKAASWFLDEIIHNNAATYATELNAWSLEYYVENAVYRLRHAKKVAIDGGVDERLQRLPEPNMIGESDPDRGQHYFFPRTTLFTPFGEWEECFHAARALDAMQGAIQYALILQRNKT